MRARPAAVCLIALAAVGLVALAQSPPDAAEVNTESASFTFQSRVNFVLVPVVVRDRRGAIVSGLHKEDFQLFDKGKPQAIEKFAVEKAGGQPIPVIPLERGEDIERPAAKPPEAITAAGDFVAYVFDDVHLTFGDLMQTRDAAWQHISASLKDSDRAAIYTFSGRTTLEFTSDRDQLHDALMKLRPNPITAIGNNCPPLTRFWANQIRNGDSNANSAAIQQAYACLHLSPDDPTAPTVARQAVQQRVTELEATLSLEAPLTLGSLRNIVRRMAAMPGRRTVLLVSPGFYFGPDYQQQIEDIIGGALRSSVLVNILDARGLSSGAPDASASIIPNPQASTYIRMSSDTDWGALDEIADGTGGEFVRNTNDYLSSFTKLATPPETWYILGFSPQNLKLDGSLHTLKVTIRERKDLVVKARKGYIAPRHLTDSDEQAKQEIQEALFSRDEISDIPIALHTQFFKPNRDQARLTIISRIDVKRLRFRKVDGRNGDEVKVVTAVFDRNGNVLDGVSKLLTMRLKDETLAAKLDGGIAIRSDFKLAPGTYIIRVVVRDAEGEMMAARNGAIEIPVN